MNDQTRPADTPSDADDAGVKGTPAIDVEAPSATATNQSVSASSETATPSRKEIAAMRRREMYAGLDTPRMPDAEIAARYAALPSTAEVEARARAVEGERTALEAASSSVGAEAAADIEQRRNALAESAAATDRTVGAADSRPALDARSQAQAAPSTQSAEEQWLEQGVQSGSDSIDSLREQSARVEKRGGAVEYDEEASASLDAMRERNLARERSREVATESLVKATDQRSAPAADAGEQARSESPEQGATESTATPPGPESNAESSADEQAERDKLVSDKIKATMLSISKDSDTDLDRSRKETFATLSAEASTPGGPSVSDEDAALVERFRRESLAQEVTERYRVTDKGEYYAKGDNGELSFRDRDDRIAAKTDASAAAADIAMLADSKGWSAVRVTGSEAFRREAWKEASARNMVVRGYEPSEQEQRQLDEEIERRGTNQLIREPVEQRSAQPQAERSAQAAAAPEADAARATGPEASADRALETPPSADSAAEQAPGASSAAAESSSDAPDSSSGQDLEAGDDLDAGETEESGAAVTRRRGLLSRAYTVVRRAGAVMRGSAGLSTSVPLVAPAVLPKDVVEIATGDTESDANKTEPATSLTPSGSAGASEVTRSDVAPDASQEGPDRSASSEPPAVSEKASPEATAASEQVNEAAWRAYARQSFAAEIRREPSAGVEQIEEYIDSWRDPTDSDRLPDLQQAMRDNGASELEQTEARQFVEQAGVEYSGRQERLRIAGERAVDIVPITSEAPAQGSSSPAKSNETDDSLAQSSTRDPKVTLSVELDQSAWGAHMAQVAERTFPDEPDKAREIGQRVLAAELERRGGALPPLQVLDVNAKSMAPQREAPAKVRESAMEQAR